MAAEWGELGGQTFGFLGVGTAPGADVHEAKICRVVGAPWALYISLVILYVVQDIQRTGASGALGENVSKITEHRRG